MTASESHPNGDDKRIAQPLLLSSLCQVPIAKWAPLERRQRSQLRVGQNRPMGQLNRSWWRVVGRRRSCNRSWEARNPGGML